MLSEIIESLLHCLCWSSSRAGADLACRSGTLVSGGDGNDLNAAIRRATWYLAGGDWQSCRNWKPPEACLGNFPDVHACYAASKPMLHGAPSTFFVSQALWSLWNVLFVVLVGWGMERRGILIKL